MIFQQLFDSGSSTYTYLLADREGGEALIIDPVKELTPRYLEALGRLDVRLLFAIDTHLHADHVTALGDLREVTGCVTLMGELSRAECVSRRVHDGETVRVGKLELRALHTPGHTDDSFSFFLDEDGLRAVFSGDALLIGGTGRTDLQNGDPGQSWDSIMEKLFRLPDATLLYPAHDYHGRRQSSIAEEKSGNPRLAGRSRAEYVEIMNGLNLASPRLMDVAVRANLACGKEP